MPSTFNVTSGADSGPGTLRQAILDANAHVNNGVPDLIQFMGVNTILTTELPTITESVEIDGTVNAMSGVTRAQSAPNFRIFTVLPNSQTFKFVRLDISNGHATTLSEQDGGGIWANGQLIVDSCQIHNNTASQDGGGVFSTQVNVTFLHTYSAQGQLSEVYSNSAGHNGGGINFVTSGGQTLDVEGTFVGIQGGANTAGNDGGGIYYTSAAGSVTIGSGSRVNGNTASHNGGGLWVQTGSLTVDSTSTVTNNVASNFGGGIYGTVSLDLNIVGTVGTNNAPGSDGGPTSNADLFVHDTTPVYTGLMQPYTIHWF